VNRYPPDTIAILSADTLAEDIPAQLLQEEGYKTKVHEANATEAMDGLLDGVDVLLLAAGRYDGLREAFLGDMGNTPRTASIPVIPISSEPQTGATSPTGCKRPLAVRQIRVASLRRAGINTETLPVDYEESLMEIPRGEAV
jgi:hypothetical protein